MKSIITNRLHRCIVLLAMANILISLYLVPMIDNGE